MQIFYKRIKELREDNDKKQNEIAIVLKIDQRTYIRYELGINKLPIEHLISLCKYYNVSADYILNLPDNLPYPKR